MLLKFTLTFLVSFCFQSGIESLNLRRFNYKGHLGIIEMGKECDTKTLRLMYLTS